MNNIYCTECGKKVEYTYSKPKFCSSCGSGFGGIGESKKNLKKNKESEPLGEDETDSEDVPELHNGLAVDIESSGNNVFSLGALMGEKENKRTARKRSVNINDFIDGRRD
jgi:ribosomal protein L37E